MKDGHIVIDASVNQASSQRIKERLAMNAMQQIHLLNEWRVEVNCRNTQLASLVNEPSQKVGYTHGTKWTPSDVVSCRNDCGSQPYPRACFLYPFFIRRQSVQTEDARLHTTTNCESNQDFLRHSTPKLSACWSLTQGQLRKNLFRDCASIWIEIYSTCRFEMTSCEHRMTSVIG